MYYGISVGIGFEVKPKWLMRNMSVVSLKEAEDAFIPVWYVCMSDNDQSEVKYKPQWMNMSGNEMDKLKVQFLGS